MSYKVGCQRPLGGTGTATWGVRAIALYNGAQLSGNCTPSKPVAFYGSHGTNDNVLGYDGGVGLAKNYATANGCTWANPAKASGAHVCTDMTGCKDGYPTTFCSFVGPHTPWPDNGSSMTSSWQPPVVWTFFNKF
jgi:poly(3-hydroxybutyrate) depolymerase